MPNFFRLTRKGESEPTALNTIDEELCAVMSVPVHKNRYVKGWFDSIGYLIACKNEGSLGSLTLRGLISGWAYDDKHRKELFKMLNYLEANYTSNGWARIGKG